MKGKIAIGLLFTFLLVNTELHQLLRLPVLLSHYQEHKISSSEISFLDFLLIHYASNVKHSDSEQHQQLPFKGNCDFTEFKLASVTIPESIPEAYSSKTVNIRNYISYYQSFIPIVATSSIWQPPRV